MLIGFPLPTITNPRQSGDGRRGGQGRGDIHPGTVAQPFQSQPRSPPPLTRIDFPEELYMYGVSTPPIPSTLLLR